MDGKTAGRFGKDNELYVDRRKKNICFRNILLPVSFQVNVLSGASQVFVSDPQYSENTMEQGN